MLSVNHLSASYTKKGPFVIEDVSLELNDGQIGVLLGPNGVGKSTFLKVLAGLLKPNLYNNKRNCRCYPRVSSL